MIAGTSLGFGVGFCVAAVVLLVPYVAFGVRSERRNAAELARWIRRREKELRS